MDWEVIDKNLFIIGVCSVINAYGIRFLWDDLNKKHQEWFLESGIKKIVIFTLLFVTTRSIFVTIFLFFIYILFKRYVKYQNKSFHVIFN
jgi:hypothetical protein